MACIGDIIIDQRQEEKTKLSWVAFVFDGTKIQTILVQVFCLFV